MEIEWLRQIVELSKLKSFSRTAAKCYISQPALSKHIASAEYALGTQIFLREGHSVRLTREGAQFVEDAQKVVADYDAAVARLNLSLKQRKRKLRIGYLDYVLSDRYLGISQSMQGLYPGCVLEFIPLDAVSVIPALKEDDIELALLMLLTEKPPESGFLFAPIRSAKNIVALPADHPLAGREGVYISELRGEPILTPSREAVIAAPLFDILLAHGLTCRDDLHFSTFYDACLMVATGAGVAFLPAYIKESEAQFNIRCLPVLDDDGPADHFGCLWKRGNSNPLVKIFVDQFAALVQQQNNETESIHSVSQ